MNCHDYINKGMLNNLRQFRILNVFQPHSNSILIQYIVYIHFWQGTPTFKKEFYNTSAIWWNYDRAQGIVSGGFACFRLGELILKKKLVKNEPKLILIMNPIGNRYQIQHTCKNCYFSRACFTIMWEVTDPENRL